MKADVFARMIARDKVEELERTILKIVRGKEVLTQEEKKQITKLRSQLAIRRANLKRINVLGKKGANY
jgi:hypothetical protein